MEEFINNYKFIIIIFLFVSNVITILCLFLFLKYGNKGIQSDNEIEIRQLDRMRLLIK